MRLRPNAAALALQDDSVLKLREQILADLDAIAARYLKDLEDKGSDLLDYKSYVPFLNWSVVSLIGWDKIYSYDLDKIPSVRRLFFSALRTAYFRTSEANKFIRKKRVEYKHGDLMRTDEEYRKINEELGVIHDHISNIQTVINLWGICYDELDDKFTGRHLSAEEEEQFYTNSYSLSEFEEALEEALEEAAAIYSSKEMLVFWEESKNAIHLIEQFARATKQSLTTRFLPVVDYDHKSIIGRPIVINGYYCEIWLKEQVDFGEDGVEVDDFLDQDREEHFIVSIRMGDDQTAIIKYQEKPLFL